MISVRLDWTPAELLRVRELAWATWIYYGAGPRRIFAREYTDACSTGLARAEAAPRAVHVAPDAYYAPGEVRPRIFRRSRTRGGWPL